MITQRRLKQLFIASNIDCTFTTSIYTCVKLWILIGFLSVCVHGTCLLYACIIRLLGGRIKSVRIQGPFQSPDKYRAGLQAKTLEELQVGGGKKRRNISLPLVLHCSKTFFLSLRKDLESVCAEVMNFGWYVSTNKVYVKILDYFFTQAATLTKKKTTFLSHGAQHISLFPGEFRQLFYVAEAFWGGGGQLGSGSLEKTSSLSSGK